MRIGLAVLGLLAIVLAFIGHYQDWLDWAIASFGLESKREAIAHRYFTAHRFAILQGLLCGFGLLLALGAWLLPWEHLHKQFVFLKKEGLIALRNALSYRPLLLFVGSYAILALCLSYWLPWHIDEAFSFAFLVGKSPLAVLSYYPGPNNHAGYLLLPSLLYQMGLPALWSMRLPALLCTVAMQVLAFAWLSRSLPKKTALLAIMIFGCTETGIIYSAQGRGYALLLLLLLASAMLLKYALRTGNIAAWTMFASCAAFGFFTVPTFLYGYVSLWAWLGLRPFRWKHVLLANTCVVMLTMLLYAPILLMSGWQAVLGNSWIQPLPYSELFAHGFQKLANIHADIYRAPIGWVFPLLANGWALLNFCHPWAKAILIFSLLPLAVALAQRVMPFARVWHYKAFFECIALAIMAIRFHKAITAVLLLVALFFKCWEVAQIQPLRQREMLTQRIYEELKPQSAYSNSDNYRTFLWMAYTMHNSWLPIETQWKGQALLLIEKAQPHAITTQQFLGYRLFYEDAWVQVWYIHSTEEAPHPASAPK